MADVSITETVPDLTEETARRHHTGRNLLVLAGAGLLIAGAVWSFSTIRAGLAAVGAERDRKDKRRR